MALQFEEQTRLLRRCLFDVHNEVGLGRHEEAYQRACELWLKQNGVPFRSKAPQPIMLNGTIVHTLFPDLIAWNAVILELKAVRRRLEDAEFVQLFDYLKCRRYRLGLLVNMGLDRVEVHRVLWDGPKGEIVEDWSHWTRRIEGEDRRLGIAMREGMRAIFRAHGTGYGMEIVEQLIISELQHRRLSVVQSPTAKAFFRGVEVHESPLECLVVNGRLLLTYSSLFDDNRVNIARGKSYLGTLGLEWGMAVNFGKRALQLTGLHRQQQA